MGVVHSVTKVLLLPQNFSYSFPIPRLSSKCLPMFFEPKILSLRTISLSHTGKEKLEECSELPLLLCWANSKTFSGLKIRQPCANCHLRMTHYPWLLGYYLCNVESDQNSIEMWRMNKDLVSQDYVHAQATTLFSVLIQVWPGSSERRNWVK